MRFMWAQSNPVLLHKMAFQWFGLHLTVYKSSYMLNRGLRCLSIDLPPWTWNLGLHPTLRDHEKKWHLANPPGHLIAIWDTWYLTNTWKGKFNLLDSARSFLSLETNSPPMYGFNPPPWQIIVNMYANEYDIFLKKETGNQWKCFLLTYAKGIHTYTHNVYSQCIFCVCAWALGPHTKPTYTETKK